MKYRFEGIGAANATLVFTALAASPWAVLTKGTLGKIVYAVLTWLGMWLADKGLILFNVGIADVQVFAEEKAFSGSMDEAFKLINAKKGKLSDAEKKAIDDKVIAAFRKFATFGKLRNG